MTLPVPRDHASDIEAARLEADQLRAQGVPEDEVLARIDERLRAVNERMEREIKAVTSAIASARVVGAPRQKGTPLPRPYSYAFGFLAIAMVLGSLLETTVGETFVFVSADAYRAALPWAMAVLIPLFAWLWWLGRRRLKALGQVPSKESVRWSIAYPAMVLLSAVMAFLAPLGLFAAYGAWAGQYTREIEGQIVRLHEPSTSSKSCRQSAEVQVLGNTAKICLVDVLAGALPPAGAAVLISGRVSSVGISIDELRAKN